MRTKPYPKWKFWRRPSEIDATFKARRCDMKSRLKRDSGYKNKKCLWKNFEEFYIDMYDSFVEHYTQYGKKETTLDRIDTNWDYCRENCRRATRLEQSQNRNYNNNYTIWWEAHCLAEWLRIIWQSFNCFKKKFSLYEKWEITKEELLNKNIKPYAYTYYIIDWKKYTTVELQNIIWISRSTFRVRYNKYIEWKITKEQLFTPKIKWKNKEQKIIIDGTVYFVSELSKNANVTRDTVSERYKKLKLWKITKEKFKQKFNLL